MDSPPRRPRLEFVSRVFTLAKDAGFPEENQDCCRVDAARGAAALADGVSSAIFSRLWAEILVAAVLDAAPDPLERESFARWLAERRTDWQQRIDASRLAWFQKPKLRAGAFSTLLWVEIVPAEGCPAWRLRGWAIGDTCLFLVREGQLVRRFPIHQVADFQRDPMVLGSVDLNRDGALSFDCIDEPCLPDDLVVLCTDALAEWALKREELLGPPSWAAYWEMPEAAWVEEIKALRNERSIRFDDTTLVLLRVARQSASRPPATVVPVGETPVEDWVDAVEEAGAQLGRQLSDGAAWAVHRLKRAGQTARSAIERVLKNIKSDGGD